LKLQEGICKLSSQKKIEAQFILKEKTHVSHDGLKRVEKAIENKCIHSFKLQIISKWDWHIAQ